MACLVELGNIAVDEAAGFAREELEGRLDTLHDARSRHVLGTTQTRLGETGFRVGRDTDDKARQRIRPLGKLLEDRGARLPGGGVHAVSPSGELIPDGSA